MSGLVTKVITASAGTGKTYRLSLEYLVLLLRFFGKKEFNPDQILVITFTRKATSEIRERIFSHLETIAGKKRGWEELTANLKSLSASLFEEAESTQISEKELDILASAYYYLVTHKERLQVMTIDSFVHSVFRNLVRPIIGIDRFELDQQAVDKRLPFLFNEMMADKLRPKLEKLISRRLKPSLDEYQAFFRSLIANRWIFYLVSKRLKQPSEGSLLHYQADTAAAQRMEEEVYQQFVGSFRQLVVEFTEAMKDIKNLIGTGDLLANNYLSEKYYELFYPLPGILGDFADKFPEYLKDNDILYRFYLLMKKNSYLWDGRKVRHNSKDFPVAEWKELHNETVRHLGDYLIFRLFLPEQRDIMEIWQDVLHHYDKLIYRYKNLTYEDVSWFTFEALYSGEPPLFDAQDSATANEFYEFLSRRTRFILIDEFQDTSILQFNILSPMIEELISGHGALPFGGFIVVGDEKQSIFGWRGGQRDLLLNMDKIYSSIYPQKPEPLTRSWRSSPTLMNFINGVFSHPDLRIHLKNLAADWRYLDICGMKTEADDDTAVQLTIANYSRSEDVIGYNEVLHQFVREMVIPALPSSEENVSTAILARRNNDLENIRMLLAEAGISCDYQSSKSILEHRIIKPVHYLLKFSAWGNWSDFLAFLRSDLVLLDAPQLKKVIRAIKEFEKKVMADIYSEDDRELLLSQMLDLKDIPIAQQALELALSLRLLSIRQSCLTVISACAIQKKLKLERDFTNLTYYLDLCDAYDRGQYLGLPGMTGFIRWCEDNKDEEILQQKDLETGGTIQLLSFHKSKGLEFDRVFVWCKLAPPHDRERMEINTWVQYEDKRYHNISDLALSMHYKSILENSAYNYLAEEDEKRQILEELNGLYVAFTRAKTRLYIFGAYESKESWQKFLSDKAENQKLNLTHIALDCAGKVLSEKGALLADNHWELTSPQKNEPLSAPSSETRAAFSPEASLSPSLQSVFPDWQNPLSDIIKRDSGNNPYDMKKSWLEDRDNLLGELAHYYLSQLRYLEAEEIGQAAIKTKRRYGNLLNPRQLDILIKGLESFLPEIKHLFLPKYDVIYTEYSILYSGREYRIDRIMLDTVSKTYWLIDYKTGNVYEPDGKTRLPTGEAGRIHHHSAAVAVK